MSNQMTDYVLCLKQCLKHPGVALSLAKAAAKHRRLEDDFRSRLLTLAPAPARMSFPYLDLPPLEYWQRNFFSILFLSIFDVLGIPRDRLLRYGLILHAVRGIVTAADNILDSEDNGAVRLAMSGGRTLPNILLIQFQDALIHQVLSELTDDAPRQREKWAGLMAALYTIGEEESEDEHETETVLPPHRLLDEIHSSRGGRLLQLAFVVPELTETQLSGQLAAAKAAVHEIGLALQMLDDVTDLREDIERRSHNLLRSWIVHRAPDGQTTDDDLKAMSKHDLAYPERAFPNATREVLLLAIETAMAGFSRLHRLGHVIDRGAALELMETLFHLRGLPHLWNIWREERAAADVTSLPVAVPVPEEGVAV